MPMRGSRGLEFSFLLLMAACRGAASDSPSDPAPYTGDDSPRDAAASVDTRIAPDQRAGGSGGGNPFTTDARPPSGGASGSASDARAPDSAPPDPVVIPAGSVPIIVALGDGGWTMTSCDRGKTWKANREFSSERADHSGWTAVGGLAFANGTFVGALGWGFPGHIIASTNGVDFSEIADSQFTRNGMPEGLNDSIGGVAFDGTQFVAFSRYAWRSPDGRAWTARDNTWPRGVDQLRQLRAFPKQRLIVASVETQGGNQHANGNWVALSDDGGSTWREGTGFQGTCASAIQLGGDIEMVGETLIVGVADVCRSIDRGRTWEFVRGPAMGSLEDLFTDGAAFYGVGGTRLMKSSDGKIWQRLGTLPRPCERGGFIDGHFVAMSARGDHVFHSTDGTSWQEVTPANQTGNQSIRDIATGYGTPSALCPN